MKISVVPQAEATLDGVLFKLPEEYDPLIPLGVDRAFYHYLYKNLESEGHTVGTIDQISATEADLLFFIGFRGGFEHYYEAIEEKNRPYLVFFTREPPAYTAQHAEKILIKLQNYFDQIKTLY